MQPRVYYHGLDVSDKHFGLLQSSAIKACFPLAGMSAAASNNTTVAPSVRRKKRLPLLPSKVEPGNPTRHPKQQDKKHTQVCTVRYL